MSNRLRIRAERAGELPDSLLACTEVPERLTMNSMNRVFGLVRSFSDAALRLWIQYLWSLRWSYSAGTVQQLLHNFDVWNQAWIQALNVWDSRHKSRDDLWNKISPTNPKRISFLSQ